MPALKFPLASRATTLLAVFALVASTAKVTAALPLKVLPVRNEPAVRLLRLLPRATPLMVLLASLALAMLPASIVLVTVPVSPVVTTVPVVAGKVMTVPVPAAAAGVSCTEPLVEPGSVTLLIPVKARLALLLLRATEVVPTKRLLFP